MSLRNAVGKTAWAVLILFSSTAARAQFPGQQQQRGKQQPKPEQISSFKGTIEQVGRGGLQISAGAGETYMVNIPNSQAQKIRVTGTAESSYLRPGLIIQFSALVDKSKTKSKEIKIKDEVKKLTLVTLLPPEIQAGAVPDPSGTGEGAATPQILVGAITNLKGNAATVNVPGLSPKVKIEIADSAAIDVNVEGYLMAQKGDGIEITKGLKYMTGPNVGVVQCFEGKITLTQPLVGRRKAKKILAKVDKSDATAEEKPKAKSKAKDKDDDKDADKAKDKAKNDKDK